MAKKPPKRQFDWKTYSRPPRVLTAAQESALLRGSLAPLLDFCRTTPGVSLEIRAHSASVYCRGVPLARISGEGPYTAEIESGSEGAPDRRVLEVASDVDGLMSDLKLRREQIESAHDSATRSKRDYLLAIAAANAGRGESLAAGDYLVVDLEYTYGRRRYDLVALKRTEGVTGPGGFSNPRLAFVDVRAADQTLTGPNGVESVAADFADFAKALGGSHLEIAKSEITELVAQKVRLGLLPDDVELRALDNGLPELLVVFAEYPSLSDRKHDVVIAALHDRLVARHFPTERLRFAELPSVPSPSVDNAEAALLGAGCAMDYRRFKDHRARGRA